MRHLSIVLMVGLLVSCSQPAQPIPQRPTTVAQATVQPVPSSQPAPRLVSEATAQPAPRLVSEATAQPTPTTPPPRSEPSLSSGEMLIIPSADDGSIWSMNPRTGEQYLLVDPTIPNGSLPWTLSPDGQTLAVVIGLQRVENFELSTPELWIVNLDGTNPQKLLNLYHEGKEPSVVLLPYYNQPLWINDNQLVVVSHHESQSDLYSITLDTGAIRRLTNTSTMEFWVSLAPDHKTLAYSSVGWFGTGGGWTHSEVWIQDIDGEPQPALPTNWNDSSFATLATSGWMGNTLISHGFSDIGGTTTIFQTTPGVSFTSQAYPDANITPYITPKSLILAIDNYQNHELFVWNGIDEAESVTEIPFSYLDISPNHQYLYSCADEGHIHTYRPDATKVSRYERLIVTLEGQTIALPNGICGHARWSDDSQWIAIGSVDDYTPLLSEPSFPLKQIGLLVNVATGTVTELGLNTIPAGWLDGDLLYFTQTASGWQLYRRTPGTEGLGQPIGKPLPIKPTNPSQFKQ